MRILSGQWKGRNLLVAKKISRPSTARLREALFSILSNLVKEARVLDLFAGSGALGFEALSRGAQSALWVDSSRHATRIIAQNANALGYTTPSIQTKDCFCFLNEMCQHPSKGFELIFADPPYKDAFLCEKSLAQQLVETPSLPPLLTENGVFIIEHPSYETLTLQAPWQCIEKRQYGGSAISFLTCLS